MKPILTLELKYEHDVVASRQRVRQIAELLGFDRQEQTRIATAVSEVARNAFEYARGGRAEFSIDDVAAQPAFVVCVRDSGPGIPNLEEILNGQYVSKTGMGLGILGARRLMEIFDIESSLESGTRVSLGKPLPRKALPLTPQKLRSIADELARRSPQNPLEEVQQQNQELLRAMDELRAQQAELAKLNQELEETNRGVVALYAELDEKAESLRRASEAKTRFLSNMTHEFRTPLNSILSLTKATLSEGDAPLDPEHRKQIEFVRKSAENLSELVNDLLDIAKVEAGRVEVRSTEFDVGEFFGGLRGALRPLVSAASGVSLVFEDPRGPVRMRTDEGKLAQILRNLVSNALKYTERGEVRVSASQEEDGTIRFTVRDSGIGIASDDQERIFEEFVQVENPLQKKAKGTGLGLPLSRKLARLLGGNLLLESAPGSGSTFTVLIPADYVRGGEEEAAPGLTRGPVRTQESQESPGPGRLKKALVIDDEEIARYIFRGTLPADQFEVIEAANGFEGVRIAGRERPDVIFLDLQMPSMSGFYVLELLKGNPITRDVPVIVHTAMTLSSQEKESLAQQTVAVLRKDGASPEEARARVRQALEKAGFKLGSPALSQYQAKARTGGAGRG